MIAGGTTWLLLVCACACSAEKWQWPEAAASVRIDNKVRFDDEHDTRDQDKNIEFQSDEPQFEEPTNTEGFYNQPPGVGRYPVRVETFREPYRVDPNSIYNLRKTSQSYNTNEDWDSVQFCKCVSTPHCNPTVDSSKACGHGKYLCCYKRANKNPEFNKEYFNEVDEERPLLLPSQGESGGPFPPPPGTVLGGKFSPVHGQETAVLGAAIGPERKPILVGPNGPTGIIGPRQENRPVLVGPGGPTGTIGPEKPNRGVLVGPGGPSGIIGPAQQNQGILVGPSGSTGIIGPAQQNQEVLVGPGDSTGIIGPNKKKQEILIGPGGPTGIIGPTHQNQAVLVGPEGPTGIIGPNQQNQGILVGPGGPTGIIGPGSQSYYHDGPRQDNRYSESAQRGVLVGPGGPTGIIGPRGYGRRPVLVGPGGPTGIIGPYGRSRPGVLVGPGGPTGMIGPPRRPYYGCSRQAGLASSETKPKPCKKRQ